MREILCNLKYTGYMVWNRRSIKKGGKCNPPEEWVWSPRPVHEPLVTVKRFQEVTPVGRTRQGSRSTSGWNRHPQTKRVYELRSYVLCDMCDRRMHGKYRTGVSYYACEADMRHHKGRRQWYADHPKSLWVREDDLMKIVSEFFADHVLGPHRKTALRSALVQEREPSPVLQRLTKEVADLKRRGDNLMAQIEKFAPTGDEDVDAEFRERLRRRYMEVAQQRKAKAAELAALTAGQEDGERNDPSLLEELPTLVVTLWEIPENLRRELFDSFNLQVRYRYVEHEVVVRVTVKESAMEAVRELTNKIAGPSCDGPAKGRRISPVLCAPGRIRTCDTRFRRAVLYPLSYGGWDSTVEPSGLWDQGRGTGGVSAPSYPKCLVWVGGSGWSRYASGL